MGLDDVKRQVAIGTRVLHLIGLAADSTISAGHVSMRDPDDPELFVVKGHGYTMDVTPIMKAEDMVVCNLEGEKVDGPPGITQCGEVKIHSCIYKRYPKVKSIVHVHPIYSILMSVIGAPLVPMGFGSNVMDPPVWPHRRRVFSDADGEGLATTLNGSKVGLLFGHGAVTTGSSIGDSIIMMEELEEQARINYLAVSACGVEHPRVPDELLKEMAEQEGWWEQPHFQKSIGTDRDHREFRNNIRESHYGYLASLVEEGV